MLKKFRLKPLLIGNPNAIKGSNCISDVHVGEEVTIGGDSLNDWLVRVIIKCRGMGRQGDMIQIYWKGKIVGE